MNNENNFTTHVNQIEKVCDICMTSQHMTKFDTCIITNFVTYLDEYLTQSSCKECNKVNDKKQKKGGRPRIYTEIPDCPNRDRFVAALSRSNRYHSNEEFRQSKAEKNRIYYESRKKRDLVTIIKNN